MINIDQIIYELEKKYKYNVFDIVCSMENGKIPIKAITDYYIYIAAQNELNDLKFCIEKFIYCHIKFNFNIIIFKDYESYINALTMFLYIKNKYSDVYNTKILYNFIDEEYITQLLKNIIYNSDIYDNNIDSSLYTLDNILNLKWFKDELEKMENKLSI